MKNQIIKITSFLLSFCLMLGKFISVQATDMEQYIVFEIPIISNECLEKERITFYKYGNSYYLTVEDIAQLARYDILDEDKDLIQLKQGERLVSISKNNGSLVDVDYLEQGNIPIRYYEGQYLLEGIPMLTYLGANCSVTDEKELCVMMPQLTMWESMMPEYEEYCFNINQIYGGETTVKVSIICDVIGEILDIGDGKILPNGKKERYKNVLYAALGADEKVYESVQELAASKNKSLNLFLTSNAITAKYQKKFDQKKMDCEDEAEFLGLAEELFGASMECFWEDERKKGIADWEKVFLKDDKIKISEVAKENSKVLYRQAADKVGINKLSDYQSFLEVVMLTADIVSTSNDLINYDIITKQLLQNALSEKVIQSTESNDLAWIDVSREISDKLSMNANILIETAYEKITKFAVEELTDKGITEFLATLSSKANIYYVAVKMAFFVVSVMYDDLFEAYASDLMAIDTNEVHRDVLKILNQIKEKAKKEGYSNIETLQQMQSLYILYYKLIISFSEQFAISLEEFGTQNKDKWIKQFAGKEKGSYSNYAAAYLYAITNCTIAPIQDYDGNIEKYNRLFEKYDPSIQNHTEIIGGEQEVDPIIRRVEDKTGLYCKWYVNADFDEDGSEEIYAFVCTSDTDYSNGELWYFSVSKGYCLFYFGIEESELFYNVVNLMPDSIAVKIIYLIENMDEFLKDIKKKYF